MKNYRLSIFGFVTVSFVLLTGFQKPGVHHALLTEKQSTSVNVKEVPFSGKESSVKSKQHKTKNKPSIAQDAELEKSLDLSIPLKDAENAWVKIEQNRVNQRDSLAVFSAEKQKNTGPVNLDGAMLMSQEPEADKRKSLDGAGVVITLKR